MSNGPREGEPGWYETTEEYRWGVGRALLARKRGDDPVQDSCFGVTYDNLYKGPDPTAPDWTPEELTDMRRWGWIWIASAQRWGLSHDPLVDGDGS